MGALGNERFLYLHVPKTGGHWVEAALEAAGVDVRPEGDDRHATLADLQRGNRFTVAFVREPLSWYASWWHHCRVIDPTWRTKAAEWEHRPHVHFINLPFPEYVEAVMDRVPQGFLSDFFRSYVGPREAEISFVGRYECLADDLQSALTLAGESFDAAALRAVRPVNTRAEAAAKHGFSTAAAELPKQLRERVHRVENEVYERFYPPSAVSEYQRAVAAGLREHGHREIVDRL